MTSGKDCTVASKQREAKPAGLAALAGAPGVSAAPLLSVTQHQALAEDGFLRLTGVIPPETLPALQALFDRSVLPSEQWPVPRGRDWRHALLDLEPAIQALCRQPLLLAAAGALIGERFFLAQVEGREPLGGGGHQLLHRDFCGQRPGDTAQVLVFLDDYGPANGATRLVPASHRPASAANANTADACTVNANAGSSDAGASTATLGSGAGGSTPVPDEAEAAAIQLSGKAGDALIFDADLLHAASRNHSGARRRTLLLSYQSEMLYAQHLQTAALRQVRMDCRERFEPVVS